jgi:murein DD-endopeptidase MepM/ murein hydrolase activator NlpD
MRSPLSCGRQRDSQRPQRLKLYSQHFAERASRFSRLSAAAAAKVTAPQRPWRLGMLGFLLLGVVIWGVAELGHLPALVEAQEAQTEEATLPLSPWDGASFPVEDFVAYTSPFGYRNHPFGGRSFHYGLDIAAPMGSYIRSWWEGKVVEVTDDTACGTSVVVQSADWLHIYCHLQGYVVVEKDGDRWLVDPDGGVQIRQGDAVKSGQRIGRIGMTGRTTGPHLHWGMKYQGSWIDPAVVLKAMAE